MTAYGCKVPEAPLVGFKYVIIGLTIIVILTAILGNIFILIVVYKHPPMYTFTNILICNCAIADLLRTQTGIYKLVDEILPHVTWFLSLFMCKLFMFCMFASLAATNIGLSFIAFDRYFLVMYPRKKIFTKRMLLRVLPIIWLIAFAFASPAIFSQRIVYYEGLGNRCVEKWPALFDQIESPKRFTILLFVFLYVLPLLLMTVLYTFIAKKLFVMMRSRQTSIELNTLRKVAAHINKMNPPEAKHENGDVSICTSMLLSKSTQQVSPENSKMLRAIKMLIIIVIGFAVSWIPIFSLQFLVYFNSRIIQCPSLMPHWLPEFTRFMQYLNSAINPFVYFGYSITFRKGIKDLFVNLTFSIKKHFT